MTGTPERPRALVVTASTRAAAGTYPDHSGPLAVAALRRWGFDVAEPVLVPDGAPVTHALREGITAGVDVILTSGGTGLSPTDRTPERTLELIDVQVPGIAEAIRAGGVAAGVPAAMLSRGVAGIARRDGHATLIVNLAGSAGAVRDGLGVLASVLAHAVDQVRGVDHPASTHPHEHEPPSGHEQDRHR